MSWHCWLWYTTRTNDNDDVAVFHPASSSLSFAMSGVSESKCHVSWHGTVLFTFENIGWKTAATLSFALSGESQSTESWHMAQCRLHLINWMKNSIIPSEWCITIGGAMTWHEVVYIWKHWVKNSIIIICTEWCITINNVTTWHSVVYIWKYWDNYIMYDSGFA